MSRIHRLEQIVDQNCQQQRQQGGCHYHRRAADGVQQPTEHGKHTPLKAFAIQSPDSHVLPLRRHRTNLYAQFILAAEGNRAGSAFQHLPGPVLQQVADQGGLLDLHIVAGPVQHRVGGPGEAAGQVELVQVAHTVVLAAADEEHRGYEPGPDLVEVHIQPVVPLHPSRSIGVGRTNAGHDGALVGLQMLTGLHHSHLPVGMPGELVHVGQALVVPDQHLTRGQAPVGGHRVDHRGEQGHPPAAVQSTGGGMAAEQPAQGVAHQGEGAAAAENVHLVIQPPGQTVQVEDGRVGRRAAEAGLVQVDPLEPAHPLEDGVQVIEDVVVHT